jgi:uncharacterized zinc-type alcohol dehydrogenase-like protein
MYTQTSLRRASPGFLKPSRRSQIRVVAPKALTTEKSQSTEGKTIFTGMGVKAAGNQLERVEYSATPMSPKDVEIQVTHNGVCHTDIHMRDDDWGVSKFPFIPGHEIVGVVSAKGNDVTNLTVGQRVGFGWIKNSCRCCPNCIKGFENLCQKGYEGTIVNGK